MKKENKVVIKKDCHSREPLSGIYNACCYHNKEKTLLNKCVEDPRLRHSGMTPLLTAARGFTLIELLVAVLIIGILAAVAVPQYRIAVYKSQLQAVAPIMKNVKEAEISHRLANGNYTLSFEQLDIDLPATIPCENDPATADYPQTKCRNFGNSFCILSDNPANSIRCTIKNPLVTLQLFFDKRYSEGFWVCWADTAKPLTLQICKAISQKNGSSNGAYIFDF